MNNLQQQASDPNYSVWVSASAGTGKTKILIDRVLKLLISGIEFQKILCLTFTNAAALEIQNRINNKLVQFANTDPEQLKNDLSLLFAREATKHELQQSQVLYQKLLSSPDKINIHTIHSFCVKILKSFPFKVGINPKFQILDNITTQEVLSYIRNQIYLDSSHDWLTSSFLTNLHEVTIQDIFVEIIEQKIKFKKLLNKKTNILEVSSNFTIPEPLSNLCNKAKLLLAKYSIKLNSDQEIQEFFLTKDSNKRKNILPKTLLLKHGLIVRLEELELIQEAIFQSDQRNKIAKITHYSNLLLQLAQIFLDKYKSYKVKHSLLDYDDLIYYTKLLLADNNAKSFLSYKLNGGIEHLLIDEAQDTSLAQWEIITNIINTFDLNTDINNKSHYTIFVVGDEKQSIFSFQGANLSAFYYVNEALQQKLSSANKDFKNITLEWSYRSTQEIIDIVYDVFAHIKNINPTLFTAHNLQILPFRATHKGRVEIWPLVRGEENNKLFWPLPEDHNKSLAPEHQLAKQIANFIKSTILSQRILPSTNLPITEADFMILVRKRDKLSIELMAQLKHYGLQVEAIDRIILNQNLAVMDLIAVTKFVLLPQDDLNLANLLKSPIIGMSEIELQDLVIAHGNNSIWAFIHDNMSSYEQIYEKLNYLLQIYQVSNVGNFFAIIIDCLNLREVLIKENGSDSNDAINELIYLSTNYANKVDSSLQNFIYWFENNEIEVKRDFASSSKIKVMTVHGSKGLQAPIVILCDTTSVPINKNKFIWTEDGELIFSIKSASSANFFKDLKAKEQQQDLQEYFRLLYVAMTRAEDHLIICGHYGNSKLPQNCWYEIIYRSMKNYAKINQDGIMVYTNEDIKDLNFLDNSGVSSKIVIEPCSDELTHYCPNPVLLIQIIKPTTRNYPTHSPLTATDYLEYGRIFHKILEDTMKIKDLASLKKHPLINVLSTKLQVKIHKNIDKLLNNKEFITLVEQELKTEITIGITLGNDIKIGRIDLMAISPNKLTIIDYKSDSNPPKNVQSIPAHYIDQLNFYRHTIQKLYSDNKITCKILWLENSNFMTI